MIDKWDAYFLRLARETARCSKDPSSKIGAVIVGEDRVLLSAGWNGFPRGMSDDPERLADRPFKLQYTVHAELNAILNAGRNGIRLMGSTIYVYGLPTCSKCAVAVAQSGITRVVMCYGILKSEWEESFGFSKELFNEVGIAYEIVSETDIE